MARKRRRKCLHCKRLFIPDYRNVDKQHYCRRAECRYASKAASQQRWLAKPENQDYFKGPSHVARVQAWRAAHPGYWQTRDTGDTALQDHCSSQPTENKSIIDKLVSSSLQEDWSVQGIVLIGFIAHLTDLTLKDDINAISNHLLRLGQDILCGLNLSEPVSGVDYEQTTASSTMARAGPPPTASIQLD